MESKLGHIKCRFQFKNKQTEPRFTLITVTGQGILQEFLHKTSVEEYKSGIMPPKQSWSPYGNDYEC